MDRAGWPARSTETSRRSTRRARLRKRAFEAAARLVELRFHAATASLIVLPAAGTFRGGKRADRPPHLRHFAAAAKVRHAHGLELASRRRRSPTAVSKRRCRSWSNVAQFAHRVSAKESARFVLCYRALPKSARDFLLRGRRLSLGLATGVHPSIRQIGIDRTCLGEKPPEEIGRCHARCGLLLSRRLLGGPSTECREYTMRLFTTGSLDFLRRQTLS